MDRLLTRGDVERLVSMSRASVYRRVRDGTFPAPLRIGVRAVRWRESEVERWIASRPRAAHGAGLWRQ